ncbi:hypothetical protein [Nitratifractor sp.]
MKHKITIEAFFFDARKDYLPYRKHFAFRLNDARPLRDVLEMIARREREFAYPRSRCWFRINDRVVSGARTVGEVVKRLGKAWQISPLSERRARHGLIIDDGDFARAFDLIAPWADASDRAYYESLYPLHYASETFRFAPEYIGDAVLLTAHRMIQRGHEAEEEILQALAQNDCGLYCAEYENNLFDPRDETAAFQELRRRIFRPRRTPLIRKLGEKLCRKTPPSFEEESIEGGSFALYTGPEATGEYERFARLLETRGAHAVAFGRSDRLIGRSLIECNPSLARLKAGTMIAEAFDSGATALVFSREVDLAYIKEQFAAIEREMNRQLPLPMISFSDFADRFLSGAPRSIPAAS